MQNKIELDTIKKPLAQHIMPIGELVTTDNWLNVPNSVANGISHIVEYLKFHDRNISTLMDKILLVFNQIGA